MTVTATTEHAILASGGDQVRRYLSIAPRPEIFTDQITAIGRDADNDSIVYLDHTNSWAGLLNPAVPHLSVDIGTTSGARDVGTVRLRYFNSTNTRMTVAETGDADIPIEVGHYASVRLEFRPWQIPKRIVLTRDGGGNITAVTEYFDYDIGYSGGANALDPKPNISAGVNADGSPKHVRRSRWVDGYGTPSEQTYATFTLSAQHSVAMNYGAVIDTTVWTYTGSGALVSGYNLTDETIQLKLYAGFHYIGLFVQDNAGASSDFMWIGVWVHNDANPPFTQFAITSDETGYDQGSVSGREMQLEFYGDADDVDESVLPKGALLNYWEEVEFDDGDAPESYRYECYGWVFNDDPLLKREDSRYGVKFGSTASWKPLFDANSITLINTGSTPTTYTEMAHMTVDRVLDWSLRAVDTLRHLVNVYYTGVTAEVERMTLPLGSAWNHLTEIAPRALLAQPACDSYGNIWFRPPIWAIPEAARDVRPTCLAITAADWWHDDGFDMPTELPPTIGIVNSAGEYWDSGDRVLYASIAPMASGGAGVGKVKMSDQFLQLPNPQEMLNILTGLYYGHANNQRKRLTLVLAGNLDVIEPAWAEPISITWAYETVRGIELAAVLFIVTNVSTSHENQPDDRTPPKHITLTLEQVTQAAAGKTVPVLQMEGVTPPEESACAIVPGFTFVVDVCTVTITNTTTGDLPLAYFLDFGDGIGYSILPNVSYSYATPGVYTVTLHVLSACFDYDTFSDDVTIDAESVAAGFSTAINGLEVTITDTSTADSGVASWSYDWGDGSTPSTTQNPVHTYATADTYTITQTITSECGTTDSSNQNVEVAESAASEWLSTSGNIAVFQFNSKLRTGTFPGGLTASTALGVTAIKKFVPDYASPLLVGSGSEVNGWFIGGTADANPPKLYRIDDIGGANTITELSDPDFALIDIDCVPGYYPVVLGWQNNTYSGKLTDVYYTLTTEDGETFTPNAITQESSYGNHTIGSNLPRTIRIDPITGYVYCSYSIVNSGGGYYIDNGVHKSTDGGVMFDDTPTYAIAGGDDGSVLNATNDFIFYVTSIGVYRNGTTLHLTEDAVDHIANWIASRPDALGYLAASCANHASSDRQNFISSDNGDTWTVVGSAGDYPASGQYTIAVIFGDDPLKVVWLGRNTSGSGQNLYMVTDGASTTNQGSLTAVEIASTVVGMVRTD